MSTLTTTSTPTVPSATVICDSISEAGDRLTTMQITMHRFVLPEFNTHRVFSRNSGSSRAIPITKQISRVVNDPAVPIEFGANQPGMQAGEPVDDQDRAREAWFQARDHAVNQAMILDQLGVHKQVANRLLEPFMWQTVIVSATEWTNFFAQRCSPLAQPEIRVVAEAIRDAYAASTPTLVPDGGWHMPYLTEADNGLHLESKKQVSAARCARVSYLTHDGVRDVLKDQALYRRLMTADPPHWSPLEHVATPTTEGLSTLGNFTGWTQLRHHNTRTVKNP